MDDVSTNSLLGYPPDARLLIINADDFGMCHAVNEAVRESIMHGIVSSTSLMAPCPWAPHAMQLLRDHPEISFGVHLTLVSEFGSYRWGPLASKDRVSSLVDEAGCFLRYERIPELIARARLDEVELEFRAQIEVVLAAGIVPDHLDWHCLSGGGRPDIFEMTFGLAREYGLALRTHDQAQAERCRRETLPSNDHGLRDSYHLGSTNTPDTYRHLMRELPPGLSEWAVHPSIGDAEARAIEPDTWQIRKRDFDFVISGEARELLDEDFDFVISGEARELLDEEGIVVLDYRALQRLWSR